MERRQRDDQVQHDLLPPRNSVRGGHCGEHALSGQSYMDGAIKGSVVMDQQLASFTYLSWLMSDHHTSGDGQSSVLAEPFPWLVREAVADGAQRSDTLRFGLPCRFHGLRHGHFEREPSQR